jgi:hypothetical protein
VTRGKRIGPNFIHAVAPRRLAAHDFLGTLDGFGIANLNTLK